MIDAVISREAIRTKAGNSYRRGESLDDNPFWLSSEAFTTWHDEWKRLDAIRNAELCEVAQ